MAITITGANGEIISLGDAPQTTEVALYAPTIQAAVNDGIAAGTAEAFDVLPSSGNPTVADGVAAVAIIQEGGIYTVPSLYQYVIVGEDTDAASGAVTLNSGGFATDKVSILAGRESGLTYNAGLEGGMLMNTVGSLYFNASGVRGGTWIVASGNSDNTILGSNSNMQISTGTGKNVITLGTASNTVYSRGQDTITGGAFTGYQTITMAGSHSDATIGGWKTIIVDTGTYNSASVGGQSTIMGGTSCSYTLDGEGSGSFYQGGSGNTVSSSEKVSVIHGKSNTFTATNQFFFYNGYGDTSITSSGQVLMFGAHQGNYTLDASGDTTGLFVADIGNETLNASGSTVGMQIYANTVVGARREANLVATGGSADDVMVAGNGNSTFSGGGGNNYYMFNQQVTATGTTVITDFSKVNDKISLFNYGLDSTSLTQLLANSTDDASGSAVLNLSGHTLTLEGVSVKELTISQFDVANTATTSA